MYGDRQRHCDWRRRPRAGRWIRIRPSGNRINDGLGLYHTDARSVHPIVCRARRSSLWNGTDGGTWVWDTSTEDWSNGDGNNSLAWTNGDTAVFSGDAAGTVTISGTVIAASIEFESSGYTIASSTPDDALGVYSGGTSIYVGASVQANIRANIVDPSGSNTLTVRGSGQLSLSGANDNLSGGVAVDAGSTLTVTGTLNGAGTLNVQDNASLSIGTLDNTGTVSISGAGTSYIGWLCGTFSGTVDNSGT